MVRVRTDIIRHISIYISEEMGIILRNTAFSPNIRDRLDYTCGVMDEYGNLLAQAEHIPVHIGSMSIGVRNTIDYLSSEGVELRDGDVLIVNDPYIAGTHLNDILLITPVYLNNRLIAYIASKAHHVDVGGKIPGSIGGDVETLYDEGVVIKPRLLFRGGEVDRGLIELLKGSVRTPKYLIGDLYAQYTSLRLGRRRLMEMADKYGVEAIREAWREILDYSDKYVRRRISGLGVRGRFRARDILEYRDMDLIISVEVNIRDDSMEIDFKGTSREVRAPINAVYGVTVASVSYTLKTILDPELPINQGSMRAIKVRAEKGSLVNPNPPSPVSGGNLETSQRIVDTLYRALSNAYRGIVPAASCGSMNNIVIGGDGWVFYETIGGGSGARPNGDGVDGVHTNMTNTLNTPIEVIEANYPILMTRYEFRDGSHGDGRYRGGLGLVRCFKLRRERAILTVLTSRVRYRPWGLNGGGEAMPNEYYVVKGGERIKLGSSLSSSSMDVDEPSLILLPPLTT